MNHKLLLNTVALRYRALYVDVDMSNIPQAKPTAAVLAMVKRLTENGVAMEEELFHALCAAPTKTLVDITEVIKKAYHVHLNWMPLVKGWDVPTGEDALDHLATYFCNINGIDEGIKGEGVTLPCGHFIPEGTFPIERYNGCPYCGTPIHTSEFVFSGQGSKLKELRLFTKKEMQELLEQLLASPTPLDATQMDSLRLLLDVLDLPADITPKMKEIRMVVIGSQIAKGKDHLVAHYFQTPTDILRYLWFEKTGKAVIVRPKSILNAAYKWRGMLGEGPHQSGPDLNIEVKEYLKLKFSRSTCRTFAKLLNQMPLEARKAAELMHPYRGMWVRFIRALRLAEYAKKEGFEYLRILLDVFYRQDYTPWMGELNKHTNSGDMKRTLQMLSTRPGLFVRCLFATMLRFGVEPVLRAFRRVAIDIPSRLLLSLVNASEIYFNTKRTRYASPITGGKVVISHNKLLTLYSEEELREMQKQVQQLFLDVMSDKFSQKESTGKTMYIEPSLFDIPVGVGDRSTTLQDTSCALQGTRFKVEGDAVRLFLQWGEGLRAQYLDMDLSCKILYDSGQYAFCSYFNLETTGAKHSGDIRSIPDIVGTAEYIELDLNKLRGAGAKYVIFMCNAYSNGRMTPNLKVGWMNSAYPMAISEETGVAYDPSCVQHLVRIAIDNLPKGMTFGVLDVEKNEITWLELANMDQAAFQTDTKAVTDYLLRLRSKCSIGELLQIKAKAQGMTIVSDIKEADEQYTYQWALVPSEVGILLG